MIRLSDVVQRDIHNKFQYIIPLLSGRRESEWFDNAIVLTVKNINRSHCMWVGIREIQYLLSNTECFVSIFIYSLHLH